MAHREDPEALRWRQWLRGHAPALLLFARQWTASAADAEDAVQAGFLKFWQTRGRASDPVSYLYACVRGAALDQGRSDRRRTRREQTTAQWRSEEKSDFEPAESVERAERHAAIEAALAELPADQREVVVMRLWGGLTFKQIGEALDVPLPTAASRYNYALKRLEAELSKEVGP